jgi:hypothetical protein
MSSLAIVIVAGLVALLIWPSVEAALVRRRRQGRTPRYFRD